MMNTEKKDRSAFIVFTTPDKFDPRVDNYIYIGDANARLIKSIMIDIFLNFEDYGSIDDKVLRFYCDDIDCFSAADEFWSRFQIDGPCTCDIDWEIYKTSAKTIMDFELEEDENG